MNSPSDLAIVGASAAGVSAAVSLRKAGYEGSISLYDADGNIPYERPPLSKSLGSPRSNLKPIVPETVYSDLDINLRLGQEVCGLDRSRKLEFRDGSATLHDTYILATGVRPSLLNIAGASLRNIFHLRNAQDAQAIGERLDAGGPLAIVGGGFIGLELAAVARTAGIDVTVIEAASAPLLRSGGLQVARLIQELHSARGAVIHTDQTVDRFVGDKEVEGVVLKDGRVIPAGTVVVGVGVDANDHLARQAGVRCGPLGIEVDKYGRTSVPWIWAVGDVTVRHHRHVRGLTRLEHWDTAQRHGIAVGSSITGRLQEDTAVPYVWSDQFEFTYQAFGRAQLGDQIVLRDGAAPNEFVAFAVHNERVHAVMGIGQPKQVRAGRTLIESRTSVDVEILRDPDVDLRGIARVNPSISA